MAKICSIKTCHSKIDKQLGFVEVPFMISFGSIKTNSAMLMCFEVSLVWPAGVPPVLACVRLYTYNIYWSYPEKTKTT